MPRSNRAKALDILAEAWDATKSLREQVEKLHQEGEIDAEAMVYLRQDDIRNQILVAQTYATLAASEPIKIGHTEAHQEPANEQPPSPQSFWENGGISIDPFAVLDLLGGVARTFGGRPVKDTPQA